MDDCPFAAQLPALLNEELSAQDRDALDEHLLRCRTCPPTLDHLTEPSDLASWSPILRQLCGLSPSLRNDTPDADDAFLDFLKNQPASPRYTGPLDSTHLE